MRLSYVYWARNAPQKSRVIPAMPVLTNVIELENSDDNQALICRRETPSAIYNVDILLKGASYTIKRFPKHVIIIRLRFEDI